MKKLYTTFEYKKRHKRRLIKFQRRYRKHKRKNSFSYIEQSKLFKLYQSNPPVIAPKDLRLLLNTESCLEVFRSMRQESSISSLNGHRFVILDLKNVKQIDYGSISVLTAISDDLKYKRILLRILFPLDKVCYKFMFESGFFDHLYDENGKKFQKAEKSDLIFFEKGSGVLSESDNKKISLMVKAVVKHLTGTGRHCLAVKTIILEICGNSIEWSGTDSMQWLLGVKYEDKKVIFTVTDVGKGILDTLYIKFSKRFFEAFKSKSDILKGSFDKKYGSTSQEVNRNKGLPAVKFHWEQGTINNLKVLTNNVILHFDNDNNSRTFNIGSPRFKGTYYQWEMTAECINKIGI